MFTISLIPFPCRNLGSCYGLDPAMAGNPDVLQNHKHLPQYNFCLPLRLRAYLSEMSLEIPPSRDLCESPNKVNCSCGYKVHSCSEFGAIPHARAWVIGNAEFSLVLLVETTCSVTFTVTHPWATLESSLHGLIVDPLTQYCVCQSTESKLQCRLNAWAFLIKNRITYVTESFWGVR